MKSLPLIDVSNPMCYLERFYNLKGSITQSALSLIMISMLSLFECITCSSSLSLEEIKLIAIVNCISNVSDFLRLFMMSFKYGVILLRYSSTDKVFHYCYFLFTLLLVYNNFLVLLHSKKGS